MKTVLFSKRALSTLSAGFLLLLLALPALAQLESGHLYGIVKNQAGEILPGVTITLSGGGASQQQVTNERGQFHFLGLAPGKDYAVKAELQDYSLLEYNGLVINVGRNTQIEVTLAPMITTEIEVVAERADQSLLDPRRFTSGSTVTNADL